MKPFDLDAAKRGAAVCTRSGRIANILSFDGHKMLFDSPEPIVAEFIDSDGFEIGSFSRKGEWVVGGECDEDLMMRDDDYMERLERGEYRNHIADANKMGDSVVKRNLITETPTCKESLPVGLTKREWFAGLALAGEIAGFFAGDCCVKEEGKDVSKAIAEDAVLFADALIAELEKNKENP